MLNSSAYRGVSWQADKNLWRASIYDPNLKKTKYLGRYASETDAARAYDREAISRQWYTRLNFYNSPELLADKSVGAIAAVATAALVSAGASTSTSASTPTSKFVGVTYHANKWRARLQVNNVLTELGSYVTEEEAAHAYMVARRCILNIPQNNNLVDLLSYRATSEANVDELSTVRPRYTSDKFVQTTVFFYCIYGCVYGCV
jgi:hypothetical protein